MLTCLLHAGYGYSYKIVLGYQLHEMQIHFLTDQFVNPKTFHLSLEGSVCEHLFCLLKTTVNQIFIVICFSNMHHSTNLWLNIFYEWPLLCGRSQINACVHFVIWIWVPMKTNVYAHEVLIIRFFKLKY